MDIQMIQNIFKIQLIPSDGASKIEQEIQTFLINAE